MNIRYTVIGLTVIGISGLAAWHYRGLKWRFGAVALLSDFDDANHFGEVENVTNDEEVVSGRPATVAVRKRVRRKLAHTLANLAFMQFGQRSRNVDGNLEITRKFIRDRVRELYPRCRHYDAAIAIEFAVELSFVPPQDAIDLKHFVATPEWVSRTTGSPSWFWWVLGSVKSPRVERGG